MQVAGNNSPKAIAMRGMIRMEFKKNKELEDPTKIESCKAAAVRALAT